MADSLKVPYNDDMVDVPKAIKQLSLIKTNKKDYLKVLKNTFDFKNEPINFQKYLAFMLLGLNDNVAIAKEHNPIEKKEENVFQKYKEKQDKIYNQSGREMLIEENIGYQRIQQGVYYLLEKGKSQDINYVEFSKALLNIFKKPLNEWNNELKRLDNNMFHENTSYITIYWFGVINWTQIFKAMYIASRTWSRELADKNYKNLITLYFNNESELKNFNLYLVKCLNFCWEGIIANRARAAFIFLLEKINALNIVGNMNDNKSFLTFFKRSISAIFEFDYCRENYFWGIKLEEYNKENMNTFIEPFISDLKSNQTILKELKEGELYQHEIKEYDVVINYLNKVQMIINNNKHIEDNEPMFRTRIIDNGHKKVEKFIAMDEETFDSEIKKSDLTPCEKIEVIKKRNKLTKRSD